MNADFLAVLEFWEREKGINRDVLVAAVDRDYVAAAVMAISKIRWEFRVPLGLVCFCGVFTGCCAERKAFVWCGEELEELLEEGGVGGKGKRKLRMVVVMQAVWAGVLAAGAFCALFLLVPQGNKF